MLQLCLLLLVPTQAGFWDDVGRGFQRAGSAIEEAASDVVSEVASDVESLVDLAAMTPIEDDLMSITSTIDTLLGVGHLPPMAAENAINAFVEDVMADILEDFFMAVVFVRRRSSDLSPEYRRIVLVLKAAIEYAMHAHGSESGVVHTGWCLETSEADIFDGLDDAEEAAARHIAQNDELMIIDVLKRNPAIAVESGCIGEAPEAYTEALLASLDTHKRLLEANKPEAAAVFFTHFMEQRPEHVLAKAAVLQSQDPSYFPLKEMAGAFSAGALVSGLVFFLVYKSALRAHKFHPLPEGDASNRV